MLRRSFFEIGNFAQSVRMLLRDDSGATSIEYGLVVGLIAIVAISAVPAGKARLGLIVSDENRTAAVQLLNADDGDNQPCEASAPGQRGHRDCPATGIVQGNAAGQSWRIASTEK